ncbi:acyl-CoA synthetase [Peribacillus butanolivorans]|uniref:acyl-CoA synthetase n=1 Tax=Peribacillus butanolivorans TaxID=421767 RepID=UPI0037CC50B4
MGTDFDLIVPEYYNIAWDIDGYADGEPQVAIYWEDAIGITKTLTYQELRHLSNKFANVLKNIGLTKGDKILIVLPRIPETYIAYIAALKLGLVISPGSDMLMPKDLLYRINQSQAKAIICYHTLTDRVHKISSETVSLRYYFTVGGEVEGWQNYENLIKGMPSKFDPVATRSDDSAFLCYTSGATGNPKGVIHDHGWVYAHRALSVKIGFNCGPGTLIWSTVSPAWIKWVHNAFINTLGSGATGLAYNGHLDGEKYLQMIEKYNVNFLCATATEYRKISNVDQLDRFKISSLKNALSAGEPLNNQVIDKFKRHFNVKVGDGYGQTENTLLITSLNDMNVKPGSLGRSTLGDLVRVNDDNGNPLPFGEVGVIAVHRSVRGLFKEYHNDPERTKSVFHGDWYMTGDLAKMDQDGYFWFEGRSDDLIISSGYTIGPSEIEEALLSYENVKECAVVPSPDAVRGAVVKAFIVIDKKVIPSDNLVKKLQNYVKTITAPYKYPREIEFVSELPKTVSGKIQRGKLRQLEKQRKQIENIKTQTVPKDE